jgi:hypothetical protein
VLSISPRRSRSASRSSRSLESWSQAQALKALDNARLSGEIRLRAGVQIDVGCCDEMLHDAVAAGYRYNEDEVLAYTVGGGHRAGTAAAIRGAAGVGVGRLNTGPPASVQSRAERTAWCRVVWREPGEPPAPIIQSNKEARCLTAPHKE